MLTLAIGIGLLLVGSALYPAPDWDLGISFIMPGFTYLFSGWSMHVMFERCWRQWPMMILLTWWCVDGCYALYWGIKSPEVLELMRDANWPASLSLYWICGLVWFWNGTWKEFFTLIKSQFGQVRI